MRGILLAGLVSLTLIGSGGVALADPDPSSSDAPAPTTETTPTSSSPTESAPAEAPRREAPNPPAGNGDDAPETPSSQPAKVDVVSGCGGGKGFVEAEVTNPNDVAVKYDVWLVRANDAGPPMKTGTVSVDAGETGKVTFEDVPGGDYLILTTSEDNLQTRVNTSVDRCEEVGPIDDPLQVFVRCENGEGLVTIRVFNTEGDARTFTVSVDDLELPGDIELGSGEFAVVVDEVPAPDGTFVVRVVAEGIDHSETVTVACAPQTSTPTTTTTTPVPQARPAANTSGGGLASTGASVGGIAVLGLLAFGLGGGLLIVSRRRRARPSSGTGS